MSPLRLITNLYEKRDGDENGEDEHAAQAVQVKRPPAHPVHQRYGDQRHDHHYASDADRRELGALLRQSGTLEQVGRVIEHLKPKPVVGRVNNVWVTYGIDTGELLRQLHDDADDEGRPERRRTYQFHHAYRRFRLLGSFLLTHLLDVLLHLVTRSQSSQRLPGFFLPLKTTQVSHHLCTLYSLLACLVMRR